MLKSVPRTVKLFKLSVLEKRGLIYKSTLTTSPLQLRTPDTELHLEGRRDPHQGAQRADTELRLLAAFSSWDKNCKHLKRKPLSDLLK